MANVQVSWTGSVSATYEVGYRRTTDTSWTEPSTSPVTGTSISLSGLDDSTQYIFRVRDICAGSISPWIYDTYTTSAASCSAITNLILSNISETTITANWTASMTAVNGYIVQYKQSTDVTWQSLPVTTLTTATITGLTAGTIYMVRIVSLCAGNNTTTSAPAVVTTDPIFVPCSNVSVSSVTIAAGASNYTATWTNTGIPSTAAFEYSVDGGTTYISFSNTVINQTPTSVTYTLPSPISIFPITHLLRVTPVCYDASTGNAGVGTYTAPTPPAQYIVIDNQLSNGTITAMSVDGSPNVLTSSIAPGGNLHYNQSGLLSGSHNINVTITGLDNNSFLTIKQIRSSTTLTTSQVAWNPPATIPILVASGVQNQDILRISKTPSINDCISFATNFFSPTPGTYNYFISATAQTAVEADLTITLSYTLPGGTLQTGYTMTLTAGTTTTGFVPLGTSSTSGTPVIAGDDISPDHSVNKTYSFC